MTETCIGIAGEGLIHQPSARRRAAMLQKKKKKKKKKYIICDTKERSCSAKKCHSME